MDFPFRFHQTVTDMEEISTCVICNKPVVSSADVVTLREKGSTSINKASEERNDSIHTEPGQLVHKDCRKVYCNPQKIAQVIKEQQRNTPTEDSGCLLRSAEGNLNFNFSVVPLPRLTERERGLMCYK